MFMFCAYSKKYSLDSFAFFWESPLSLVTVGIVPVAFFLFTDVDLLRAAPLATPLKPFVVRTGVTANVAGPEAGVANTGAWLEEDDVVAAAAASDEDVVVAAEDVDGDAVVVAAAADDETAFANVPLLSSARAAVAAASPAAAATASLPAVAAASAAAFAAAASAASQAAAAATMSDGVCDDSSKLGCCRMASV